MLLVRQNIKGGPKLKDDSFPIVEENGVLGYRVGYTGRCGHCGKGDGEQVVIRTIDAERIANRFASNLYQQKTLLGKLNSLKPRRSFREWLFLKLFGKQEYKRLKEEYEEEIGD